MPRKKVISKEQILAANAKTNSGKAAARYLHISYDHYQKYAKMYKDNETGKSLYEMQKNIGAKGVKRLNYNHHQQDADYLQDIIDGEIEVHNFKLPRLKELLVSEGYLKNECKRCGFNQQRKLDNRPPLILHFKDGDRSNFRLYNIEFLCYNCYYIHVSDVFTDKDIESFEVGNPDLGDKGLYRDLDLNEFQLEQLQKLNNPRYLDLNKEIEEDDEDTTLTDKKLNIIAYED